VVDARDVAAAAIRAITAGAHARRYIKVPAATAMAGAAALELSARLRRRDPAVTRAGTRVLLEGSRQHLTAQRAERELGATFRSLGRTIADEAAWYRSNGMLPTPRDAILVRGS
jgi:nucleoside-diphosphate-sugar epimerase